SSTRETPFILRKYTAGKARAATAITDRRLFEKLQSPNTSSRVFKFGTNFRTTSITTFTIDISTSVSLWHFLRITEHTFPTTKFTSACYPTSSSTIFNALYESQIGRASCRDRERISE